jgi:capsular exopolysaccharide synthesis family protein
MTIEDAIRRAKLLGQARTQGNESAEIRREHRASADGGRSPARVRESAVQLASLKSVAVSQVACEQNRVMLSEYQLREFPAVDAAYRLLRSRLQNRLNRNHWSAVAIASPSQSDGKTLTTLNVAISIAREKQRPVCVLDLDMRNPSVCRFLGIQDIRPLPDYFRGEAKVEEVLAQTSVPNLIVAGALEATDSASELLAGPQFSNLLAQIRNSWPNALVLVDMPPVSLTDEALLIGPHVDAILLVVSEGMTERKLVAQALASLSEFTVAGVVVNRSTDSHTVEYSRYTA